MGMNRQWRGYLVLLASLAIAGSAAGSLEDDFESYEPDTSIAGHGHWHETALGRQPANQVVAIELAGRSSQVLRARGGGDHRDHFIPPDDRWQEALAGPVVELRFLALAHGSHGAVRASFGRMSKYHPQRGLTLQMGSRLSLHAPEGQQFVGLSRLQRDEWHEIVMLIERDNDQAGQAHVSIASRNLTRDQRRFQRDPVLQEVAIDLSERPISDWTGIAWRLDNAAMIDQVRLRAVPDLEIATRDWADAQEPELPFEPLLGHLAGPREAKSLGGVWESVRAEDAEAQGPPGAEADWQPVVVPEDHRELFSGRDGRRIWFGRSFDLPESWEGARIRLHFERMTEQGRVYLNGELIGTSDEGHWPVCFDITEAAHFGRSNELAVGLMHPRDAEAVGNRPVGWIWYYEQFVGLPFPVHVERHGDLRIQDVQIMPMLGSTNRLQTRITLRNDTAQTRRVELQAGVGDAFSHQAKAVEIPASTSIELVMEDAWDAPRLWWPHDPHLYKLDVRLREADDAGRELDAYRQRFGFRELDVQGKHLMLNGRRYMHRRTSLIPYWRRTQDAWLAEYFENLRAWGYVGLRTHGVPSQRIIHKADERGMLVSPETGINEPRGHDVNESFWEAAEQHVEGLVRLMRNNPSVVYWSMSNEFASNYMPQGHEKAAQVDAKMHELGQQVMRLDPTRTVTYSGDLDLGGRGERGPAPTLSFHYPWQPFKLHEMLPTTVYWLDEGRRPWQGIVWEHEKPLIISEDLHAPYAFKPPHGMTQWAGDAPYGEAGKHKAWFEAVRMLAEGYYHAGIAGWNPWSVPDGVYEHGQLMPDYLIAAEAFNRTFESQQSVDRVVHVYNQLFEDHQAELRGQLILDDQVIDEQTWTFDLLAGERHTQRMTLPMPQVSRPQPVQWRMTLHAGEEQLTERTYDYTIFPADMTLDVPEGAALVASGDTQSATLIERGDFDRGVYRSVGEALAADPAVLVLAGVGLDSDAGAQLEEAVRRGLRVLWLEAPEDSWLPVPLQINASHYAAHAFIRAEDDPIFDQLREPDLQRWGEDTYVTHDTLFKPEEGRFDILADAGGPQGLNVTPLLRLHRGEGEYLMCQMPVLSKAGEESAAGALLGNLVASLHEPSATRGEKPLALAAGEDSPLRQRLTELQIPFVEASSTPVGMLIVDAAEPLEEATLRHIGQHLQAGHDVWAQRLGDDAAAQLADSLDIGLSVSSADARQVLRARSHRLLRGLSNDDLYWIESGDDAPAMLAHALAVDGQTWDVLTEPAALAVRPVQQGRLFVCQIRWDEPELVSVQASRSPRVALTLLHNAGAEIDQLVPGRREITPLDLTDLANRGFHDRPDEDEQPRGWFAGDDPRDDMRYFPVNRTGIDPIHNVPAPLEPFPDRVSYGGMSFDLINPEENQGRAVLVLDGRADAQASETGRLSLNRSAERVWMLGALGSMASDRTTVAELLWRYEDGSEARSTIEAGVHVQGYQYFQPLQRGRLGWSGNNPLRDGVVLYVWEMENPHPGRRVAALRLAVKGEHGLALAGLTLERMKEE